MGIYEEPKITLVAIGAFFPVFTTVASGLAAVDRNLIEVGRTYGLKGVKLVTKVLLPAASPIIFSGLRLGLAQAWLFLVAAELIASSMGLGFLLTDSQNTARTDILFMAIILLALLGKLSDVIIVSIEKRALRWI
jgi:sulfonate transport system permease protein